MDEIRFRINCIDTFDYDDYTIECSNEYEFLREYNSVDDKNMQRINSCEELKDGKWVRIFGFDIQNRVDSMDMPKEHQVEYLSAKLKELQEKKRKIISKENIILQAITKIEDTNK